jgi:hypothetical protein
MNLVHLRSIVIYSELKKFRTVEMKTDKKERNSKKSDSVSNVKSTPIGSFGGNVGSQYCHRADAAAYGVTSRSQLPKSGLRPGGITHCIERNGTP